MSLEVPVPSRKKLGRATHFQFCKNRTSVNAEETKKAYKFMSHNMQDKILA
jgi:hypothetical protein